MSQEYVDSLKGVADPQLIFASQVQLQRIRKAEELINNDNNRTKKQKVVSKDNVHVTGLPFSLGESLMSYADNMEVKDAKSRYFFFLSKNSILDISNTTPGSQMDSFSNLVKKNILKKFSTSDIAFESRNIRSLLGKFKINSFSTLQKQLTAVEKFNPNGLKEKNIKRIYEFILSMHAERPWVFNKEARSRYTEADYQFKFWAYIFEMFFADNQSVALHWGDAITSPCKNSQIKFKLDLRPVIYSDEAGIIEGMTAEDAKKATKNKLYSDKLKSILASKCHLNNFLKSASFITSTDIKKARIPIVQIMGLDVHVYVLTLVNRGFYVKDDIFFSFPSNYRGLRSDLEKLVDGLSLVESLVNNLRLIFETNQLDNNGSIKRAVEESPQKKKMKVNSWITKVFYEDKVAEEDGDEDEDRDDDDEEDEDEDEE